MQGYKGDPVCLRAAMLARASENNLPEPDTYCEDISCCVKTLSALHTKNIYNSPIYSFICCERSKVIDYCDEQVNLLMLPESAVYLKEKHCSVL